MAQGGATDRERGDGDVQPWRPPLHASPVVHKGPISSKRVSSQDPLLRKFGNFSLYNLNFHPKYLTSPKFGNFQLTSSQAPNLEIFSSQAPLFRGKYQFTSLIFQKSGLHTPTWKKVECPGGGDQFQLLFSSSNKPGTFSVLPRELTLLWLLSSFRSNELSWHLHICTFSQKFTFMNHDIETNNCKIPANFNSNYFSVAISFVIIFLI